MSSSYILCSPFLWPFYLLFTLACVVVSRTALKGIVNLFHLSYFMQESAKKNWLERNAESVEVALEVSDNEEERVKSYNQKKITSGLLKKLQQVCFAVILSIWIQY